MHFFRFTVAKLVHKAKCSNVASQKEKKVCEKCADKLMKNREICNDSGCEKANLYELN